MVTTNNRYNNNCWRTAILLLHRLLLAIFCYSPTTVVGSSTNDGKPTTYTCTFPGASIPCFGDQDYYACCYEPYGDVMYKCGLDCYGEITYQRPANAPTNNRTTYAPWLTTPYEKTTSWKKDGASDGVELSVILLIAIPVASIGVALVAVGISWCYTLYKRNKREPQSSGIELRFRNYRPNDDIENALNESRQDAQLNDAPPDYHTAVNEQASPFLDSRTVQTPLSPPSYATVT